MSPRCEAHNSSQYAREVVQVANMGLNAQTEHSHLDLIVDGTSSVSSFIMR